MVVGVVIYPSLMAHAIPPPFGFGPWHVMLVANVHPNPGKKTDIRLHTNCELLVKAMNQGARDQWVSILEIGPFESWDAAVVFKSKWEKDTRNLRNRIDRGWYLFQLYRQSYRLILWYQPVWATTHTVDAHKPPSVKRSKEKGGRRRKRLIAYRDMVYDQNAPRISIASIQHVESKRQCLGMPMRESEGNMV